MLEKGGNAFDAAIAGAFAATVAEPCLTSLGGGGFMLAYNASRERGTLYDFFVDSPGKGRQGELEPHFEPVEVCFASTVQEFHAGLGSVAVPGMLKGLLECYRDLCTMDMEDLIAPALGLLDKGVESNPLQMYLSRMLMPILSMQEYGREIFRGTDEGGRYYNPLYREFLLTGDPGKWLDVFHGRGAPELEAEMKGAGGLLTALDMTEYEVVARRPLLFGYRGHEVLTNGPPSFGGELLAAAFGLLELEDLSAMGPRELALEIARAMKSMSELKRAPGGTTHISVIDREGNAASLTSSNGSNSGCYLGGTGVMLNNMMGEDDLHPGGFHAMRPGLRVGSMMSPAIIKQGGNVELVLGSGGSKRIRTAMLQVMHNMIDRGLGARDAVEAPRMHLDDEGILHMEPGFPGDISEALSTNYPLNAWAARDLFFGGVHVVTSALEGWGDTRRGGAFKRV
jgi:gamma-glutamyltranspeptidase/glutathione hydrolase